MKRAGGPLGPHPSFRVDWLFRLAMLLRLAQLVPDIHLDSPGARLPHFLGGGLLALVSLAPASPGGFVQLVPDVVLCPTGLLNVARCLGALLGRVGCVGAALLDGGRTLQAVVGVHLDLKLWGDLPVVVEGGAVLGGLLVGGEDYGLPLLVDGSHLERIRVEWVPKKSIFTPMYSGG